MKFVEYTYGVIGIMCILVGILVWEASIFDLNFNGGKAIILFIPAILLGVPWELLFGPEGSATLVFWCVSAFCFYMSWKYHKKSLQYSKS